MEPASRQGVVVGGVVYTHTPHFLSRREAEHPEATDERVAFVLEAADVSDSPQGNRRVYWGEIREPGVDPWWLKVVVADNPSGPAILSAYRLEDDE